MRTVHMKQIHLLELTCSVSCGQVLAAAVEAATGAEPVAYSDADITSYEEGKTYCERHGVRRARAVMGADTPLSPGSLVGDEIQGMRRPG